MGTCPRPVQPPRRRARPILMTTSLRTTPVLLVAALLLAGCGGSGPENQTAQDPAAGSPAAQEPVSEPCPATLPRDDRDAGEGDPPEVPEADQGWVCEYGGPKAPDTWRSTGDPAELDEEQLADVRQDLESLEPADLSNRMCTMDLGPRYLVVLAAGEDVLRVSVDDFGCRSVRVVGEPGVLDGPSDLVEQLRSIVG